MALMPPTVADQEHVLGQGNAAALQAIKSQLYQHIRGKSEVIDVALSAFLAGGHILLEGPPGVGKTSLAKGIAHSFGGTFRRIQMTSDLLPSDIVGILRLKPGEREFEFRQGPIFANFVLADELNRTSPKTQSALLEAMAEGTVSVDGSTYRLPDPFVVLATQNPLEFQGVYPLAESQLDRFMVQIALGSPDRENELAIHRGVDSEVRLGSENIQLTLADALALRRKAHEIHIEESVLAYAVDLARASRSASGISHGVSVRGGLQLVSAAKALAFVKGRDFVVPADVAMLAVPVMAHRLCFESGQIEAERSRTVIEEILERVPAPR